MAEYCTLSETARQLDEPAGMLGDELFGRLASRFGSQHVLQRVLVGPSEEPDIAAEAATGACCEVCVNKLERVPVIVGVFLVLWYAVPLILMARRRS
jgi:hypothetical protein